MQGSVLNVFWLEGGLDDDVAQNINVDKWQEKTTSSIKSGLPSAQDGYPTLQI